MKTTISIAIPKEKKHQRETRYDGDDERRKKANEEKLSCFFCSRINVIDFDKGCFVNSRNPTRSPPSLSTLSLTWSHSIEYNFYQTDAAAAARARKRSTNQNNVHRNAGPNYRFVMLID